MNNCPDGKCDVAARIAAARAGRLAGTGKAPLVGYDAGGRPIYDVSQATPQFARPDVSMIPMEQRDARNYMPKLPSAQSSFGIGAIAAVVLVIIIMSGKK